MDICTRGHTKRRASKKNRNWLRRLHLRKTVVQPPAMQSPDKNGPKKIAKKWEQTSVRPLSKEPPQEGGGNPPRFPCSRCEDNSEYAPKDLMRHFVEKHRGSPPVFSCHQCTFSAHEFSYLQVHLLSHKDTFSSCSMCCDDVRRTWSEFSEHLTKYHCTDGKYSCETCKKFSTCDFWAFLDHMYKHNLSVEEAGGRQLPAAQTPCCQFCGFEAPEKLLVNKQIMATHVCQNGNRVDRRQVHSAVTNRSDPIPRVKTRLTRSAVRDACRLTQDCLLLPGKEFLDKYCHLSDPQTTLEETQQFLMQSVAGETDDQKWTKALKSVLHKNSENSLAPNTSDLTVLTVKNKITVAQNGLGYPKRPRMTSTDKDPACPGSIDGHSLCASDQKGFCLNLKNQALCLPSGNISSSQTGAQENRENHKLKVDLEVMENGQKPEEALDGAGIRKSSDLKLTNENDDRTSAGEVSTKGKVRKRHRGKKARFKKAQRRSEGEALKIVIKKNLVKKEQWLSESSSCPTEELDDHPELPNPVRPVCRVDQNCILGSPADPPAQPQHTAICESVEPPGDATTENQDDPLRSFPSTQQKTLDAVEKPRDSSHESGSDEGSGEMNVAAAPVTEEEPKPYRRSDGEATGENMSSSAATPHGKVNLDSCLKRPIEETSPVVEALGREEAAAESGSRLLSGPRSHQRQTSPAARRQWLLVPKHQQRTLKLVAINPSQPVKRPAGDQPVVVLNHPDADVPQVARIMEVVNKYKEVRKVLLSRRTLRALSAPGTDDAGEDRGEDGAVQERFTLRLKFRRVSRKKYEVVGVAPPPLPPGRDAAAGASSGFSCWFCGRVFASQEGMMAHRQRHLVEWKKPNCEKS